MKPLMLEEIRQAVHGRWLARPDRAEVMTVTGVSTDSRTARPGELFVALRGERFDGHRFLADAADAGSPAALVRMDSEPPPQVAANFAGGVIGLPDTTRALGELAGFYRGNVAATVVAVTGSNGKTTVKRMIHHILSRRLSGSCSPKSFNNSIGVPLTLLGVEGGDDYVVCEIGSSAPGEVAALAKIARPDVAVITSVAPTHLESFQDIERVAVEKASILGQMHDSALAVVWADSEVLDKALRFHRGRIVRFGVSASAQLRLTGYAPAGAAQRFELNGRLWVDLPMPGRHNAVNALAAIAVAQRLGFTREQAAEALADFPGVEMRLQWIDHGRSRTGLTIINDAYNANPASLLAAAEVLAECKGKRRVLIAGDMRELGEQARRLHLQAGRDIAAMNIDLLIGVGRLGRYIARAAADAGMSAEVFSSLRAARAKLAELLRRGDVVLIKGSRAMEMEQLIEPIHESFAAAKKRAKTHNSKGRKR